LNNAHEISWIQNGLFIYVLIGDIIRKILCLFQLIKMLSSRVHNVKMIIVGEDHFSDAIQYCLELQKNEGLFVPFHEGQEYDNT